MHYKIVEYAAGDVAVFLSFDGVTWEYQTSYDGERAMQEARDHVRNNVPQRTVMREEIIDV